MGRAYYAWALRRSLGLSVAYFLLAGLGWSLIVGTQAYVHFLANAVPLWAMMFVVYAGRYPLKQRYYRDVLGRKAER